MENNLKSNPPATLSSKGFPISPAEPRTNTLFAFEPVPEHAFNNPFADTQRITLPKSGEFPAGIEVVAGPGATVQTYRDETTGCCAYVWGRAAHCDVPGKDLLPWIVNAATGTDVSQLRFLVGTYLVLIDDRRNRRVLMISDIIGLRPWFVGQNKGRLVCGGDVWDIQKAGIDMGGINYDAVAFWLRFAWDCSGQSLFKNFPEMGYGSVGIWQNGKYCENRYFTLTGGLETPSTSELFEGIRDRVSRNFDAQTHDLTRVNIPLSGGYDSRFVAALAKQSNRLEIETFCVSDREAEQIGASDVAKAFSLKLQTLRTDGTVWNMFAEPYHFTAGGFPITKQITHLVASQRPSVPLLSGFFGDPTVRGSQDRFFKKTERQLTEDFADIYRRTFVCKHLVARFDLIDPRVIKRADERIIPILRKHLDVWAYTQHPLLSVSLFFQQRHFMGNNIAQLIHITEAVIPFVSWECIEYKMRNDPDLYSYETYGKLLAHCFPEIGHIPHNNQLGEKNRLVPRQSDCIKPWTGALLKSLCRFGALQPVRRRKAIPRLLSTLIGRKHADVVALFLYRLYLLESRLQRAGMELDWNEI